MDTILFLKYFSFTGECKTMFLRETWVKLHQFDIVLIMTIKLQNSADTACAPDWIADNTPQKEKREKFLF